MKRFGLYKLLRDSYILSCLLTYLMFDVFQKSKRKSPESPNGVISNPPDQARQSSPPPAPPPLEVRVAEVIVEQNRNLSPPSTDAVNATTIDVPVSPSSSAPPEVVVRPRAAAPTRFAGKSNEEAAAILIQTVFRGYLVCFCLYNSTLEPPGFVGMFYCSID